MKLITRDADYAIRALAYMAKVKKGMVPVSKLVDCTKIPRPFMRKIMQKLGKKGYVRSYRGIGGGFILMKAPDKIILLDLIKDVQGRLTLNECLFKKVFCPRRKKCVLKKRIDKLERGIIKEFRSLTIKDVMSKC
jgi:Rrf2 family transcriptional regulator, iron-sulfur cluster assembly transcription factor